MTGFNPRRDVQAISHVNVVVDDVEVATEFYSTVLGFEQAANADGPMDYPERLGASTIIRGYLSFGG
jgi:catechol 2,3-dioxygenase-like lactoylglutathione lyase family enzyme